MTDTITIKNIDMMLEIGAYAEERGHTQPVSVDITLGFDAARAAASDNVADTIDYYVLTQNVMHAAQNTRFHLLEALADTLMEVVMADPRCQWCQLDLRKPDILKSLGAHTVATFTTRRTRS